MVSQLVDGSPVFQVDFDSEGVRSIVLEESGDQAIELKGKKTVTPENKAWAHSVIAGHGPRLYYVKMYNLR